MAARRRPNGQDVFRAFRAVLSNAVREEPASLILVLGLRKGEVLGLTWELTDLESGELFAGEQLQRVEGQLLRRETKTESSVEPRNFNRSFDYRIVKARVRGINVHGIRKTCGTLLAALDAHPRVAMQILRHSRISVTMEIYTETTSEATRAALKQLDGALRRENPAE